MSETPKNADVIFEQPLSYSSAVFNVQCSDVIVCSLYIQAGDQKTMAVKCGGRGEVRSHGGTVSSLQQQLHCALLGVPFLVQVTDNNTYLALGLGIQKNVREWRNSAYISVLFGWHRQMRPQSGPYSSARAHARWSHNAPRQPADIFHVGENIFHRCICDIYRPGGQEQAPSTGSQLAPFSQRHWCWQPWP